jgi:aspartyl-tRNA(Asn)/glutamyl-tRNA(Gln) amidotransferase subunit B
VRADMPELPAALAERLQRTHGLPAYDATMMTASRATAAYFEAAVAAGAPAKPVANWLMGEFAKRLNTEGRELADAPVKAPTLATLLGRIGDGTISNNAAKQVFEALWSGAGHDVDAVIEAQGLKQMNDSGALDAIVDAVLAANAKSVDDYRAGKEKAFGALVGQVMKASKGKANPAQVNEVLKRKLGG